MDTIGTININVENKFLKLWYKKNKVTLQDVSLSRKEGPMGESKEVIQDSKEESETYSIAGEATKPKEGHNKSEGLTTTST
jgi:hypothetical protein